MKRGSSPRARALPGLLLGLLVCAGCGYHFAAQGDTLPASAKTIYVAGFTNQTRFTGVNDQFTLAVKDEIAHHDRLKLVDAPAEADLLLAGEIRFMDMLPTGYNSVSEPTLYGQTMTVSAKLTDRRAKRVIWQTAGLTNTQSVATVAQAVVPSSPVFLQENLRAKDIEKMPDLQVMESQQYYAQHEVLEELAATLYDSMSNGF